MHTWLGEEDGPTGMLSVSSAAQLPAGRREESRVRWVADDSEETPRSPGSENTD